MDRQQVAREVLTIWTDIYGYDLPADKSALWHAELNDSLKRLCDAHPERFSWMASGSATASRSSSSWQNAQGVSGSGPRRATVGRTTAWFPWQEEHSV